jgi:D-3-phosphoglycerate dehydrogenase / 2-oxoglutarate reductase
MSNLKILLTDGLNENGQAILRAVAHVDDCEDISAEDLLKVAGEYDAMIVRGRTKMTEAVFNAAGRLKVVGRAGVGVDNIDLAAAKTHGVTVVYAPRSTSRAVAELTLALMLSLARSVPRADAAMKAGQWIKKQLEGVELSGKTLGIVGLGNIGSVVLQCSVAMGMKVIGYDPLLPDDEIRRRGAEPVSLAEMYAQADFITLHIPLTPDTRGMINRQALSKMKPGVRLICAARGGVIEEDALLEALNSGQVAGAALDVFAKEPPGQSALASHPNVVATPHIGAQTEEAQARASADIASEVLAALRGEALRWRIV